MEERAVFASTKAAAILSFRFVTARFHPTLLEPLWESHQLGHTSALMAKILLSLAGKVSGGGLAEKMALSQVWLSMVVEGDILPGDGEEPLMDWRLVVSPPLLIHNQLPATGSFLVWEVPRVSRCF